MRDETLLALLDVLDGLALGYKECAQKIYSAEYAVLEDLESAGTAKLYQTYLHTKCEVMSEKPGLGVESETPSEV